MYEWRKDLLPCPGDAPAKHIYKIPLCNLVGRSIERPLKSPLVNKVLTAAAPGLIGSAPTVSSTPSLSLSRMEIKEIASRTRKELLGENGRTARALVARRILACPASESPPVHVL